ncbi:adhesion G protein-coupled receptor E3-like [Clupea harengus]|uniref:Adhesion G protein-coupled receptor E3-like n=1 Tax=Clupea harengus TaxID=7950 RepID=A0A8M1KAP9_CLUHA|nr:adhesion G protein-coupled receptor E3-like [Clupea harengus]
MLNALNNDMHAQFPIFPCQCNVIFFTVIFIGFSSIISKANTDISKIKQMKILIMKTAVQFFILGCPWILGFFVKSSDILNILFLFLNSQQGTFLFLVHCVLNEGVRQQYRKWWLNLKQGSNRTNPYNASAVTKTTSSR